MFIYSFSVSGIIPRQLRAADLTEYIIRMIPRTITSLATSVEPTETDLPLSIMETEQPVQRRLQFMSTHSPPSIITTLPLPSSSFNALPSPLAQIQSLSPPSSPECSYLSPATSRKASDGSTKSGGGGRKASVSLQLFKETVREETIAEGKKSRTASTSSAAVPALPSATGKGRGWTSLLDGAGVGTTTTTSFKSKGRDAVDWTISTVSPTSPDPCLIRHNHPRSPYKTLSQSPRRHSPSPSKRSSSPMLSASTSNLGSVSGSRSGSPRNTTSRGVPVDLVPEFVLPKAALSPSALSISSATSFTDAQQSQLDTTAATTTAALLASPLHLPSASPQFTLPPPTKASFPSLDTPKSSTFPRHSSAVAEESDHHEAEEEQPPSPEQISEALLEVLEEEEARSLSETERDQRRLDGDEELFSQTQGSYTETGSDDDDEWSEDEEGTGEDDEEDHADGTAQAQRRLLSDDPNGFTYPVDGEPAVSSTRGSRRPSRGAEEEAGSALRRVVTVPLEPFDHQVGGHSHIFRFSKKAVCKVSRIFCPSEQSKTDLRILFYSLWFGEKTNFTRRSNALVLDCSLSFLNTLAC